MATRIIKDEIGNHNNELRGIQNYENTIYGYGGNDTLYGANKDDVLYGGTGNDKLYGDQGDDRLYGGAGRDRLNGDKGDDHLYGDTNDIRINGGYGVDSLRLINHHDFANINLSRHRSGLDNDYRDNFFHLENVTIVSDTKVSLTGSDVNNYLETGYGNDNLKGLDGNDTLYGNKGNDTLDGGKGKDILNGGSGIDTVIINNANKFDNIDVNLTSHRGKGGEANDDYYNSIENAIIHSGERVDLTGEHHNNVLETGTGNDKLFGMDGDDTLKGNAGYDELHGNDGNDTLYGGSGKDFLYGDQGHDDLYGGKGKDEIDGGEGIDTIMISNQSSTNSVNINLALGKGRGGEFSGDTYSNIENAVIHSAGRVNLTGDDHDNLLETGSRNDKLFGMKGDDILKGHDGNDIIKGGGGMDTLYGGNGNDILYGDNFLNRFYGGEGDDTFVISSSTSNPSGNNMHGSTIFDFQDGDKIDLSFSSFSDISLDYSETNNVTEITETLPVTGEDHPFSVTVNGQLTEDDFIF